MRKVLIVNQNLAIDKTASVEKIKRGFITRFPRVLTLAGGKGVNVARALKSLGVKGDIIGFTSGYNGKWIESAIKKEGFDSFIIRHNNGESRICYSITDKEGVSTDFNEDGPKVPLSSQSEFFKKLKAVIEDYSILIVCGRTSLGIQRGFYKRMISLAKKKGVKIFFDISGDFLSECLSADLIKINRYEFEEFSGLKFNGPNIAKFFKAKSAKGLKMLIVTNRSKPGYAVNANGFWRFNPLQINGRLKSCVGAGDSFMAGCVYGALKNFSGDETLKVSVGCATSDCLSLGAGVLKKADVLKFSKKVLPLKRQLSA